MERKTTGGEEGISNRHVTPPLSTIWDILALPRTREVLSFLLSPLITRLFYWSVTLLAAWSPKMALKLDGAGPWSVIVLTDPLLLPSQGSRRKHTLTALPFAQPMLPNPSEGAEIKLAHRGLLLHWSRADGLPAHTRCWCAQQGLMALFQLWRWRGERSFHLVHLLM